MDAVQLNILFLVAVCGVIVKGIFMWAVMDHVGHPQAASLAAKVAAFELAIGVFAYLIARHRNNPQP
jgi:hypothetical protein